MDNQPAEILKIELQNLNEEWGNDLAHWHLVIRKSEGDYVINLWFESLWQWCKHNRPEWETYFSSVRRSIRGFGPKHNNMFRIFYEEKFDFLPVINAYIAATGKKDWMILQSPSYNPQGELPDHKVLEKRASDLDAFMKLMQAANIRNETLMDNTLIWVTAEVMRIYPEILNADGAHIRKLDDILIKHIMNLGSDIDALAYSAQNGTDPYAVSAIL